MKHMLELMIAEKIRKFRREKNVTQEQMAQAIGVSAQSVSKWECGTSYPDIELLPQLASVLKISIDSLLGYPSQSVTEYDSRYNTEEYYWGLAPNDLCYAIMRIKPPIQPYQVLDIGCGEGKDAVFLARNGYRVTAFDASEQGLAKARALACHCGVNVDFFRADVRDFRLETDYDIIFSSGVFHYIPPELRQSVIENLKAHTAPNGLNVINVFVRKPFIPLPPDMEAGEFGADDWKSGELFVHYHDWLFHKNDERIFDCSSGGVPHKHCMDVLIAEKV